MPGLRLVVGLGNPGPGYAPTRHNVGFRAVDRLREECGGGPWRNAPSGSGLTAQGPEGAQGRVLLAKPMTFMNLSGEFVASLSRYLKIPAGDVLVVCDDISLPLGRLRLRPFGSSGGQRGLESVLSRLGTQEVPRLRLGVGPLPPEADAADFVLDRFRPDEAEAADAMVSRACEALRFACGKGLEAAMNAFNPA